MSRRFIRFILILSALILYTFYQAIQLWPSQGVAAIVAAVLLFALMLSTLFIPNAKPRIQEQAWFRVLSWISTLTMALWATYILFSIPVEIVHLGASFFGSFDFHLAHILVLELSFGAVLFGLLTALVGPEVKEVTVPVQGLPPSLDGLKIAQLSDLHVGPTIRRKYVEEVVRKTNALNPDLIFFTGDLADAEAASIVDDLKPLGSLKSRYGSFSVPGNHEYYWDPEALIEAMRGLGFTPLLNENRVVKVGDHSVMIAGVTDPQGAEALPGHAPNVEQAVNGENSSFKILLAHRPDACEGAEPLGVDLQFSGHTHAGQFYPFGFLIGLAHDYTQGLNRHGRMWVYVNRGTGYWGPPNRLGIRAEISLIRLQRV